MDGLLTTISKIMAFLPLNRKWINLSISNPPEARCRIMHFNVLADELTKDSSFFNTDPEDLQWDTRKERLLDLIKETNPDILSLVECDHYEDFWAPELGKLGLTWSKKTTKLNISADKTHGVALFINPLRFTLVNLTMLRDPVAAICITLYDNLNNVQFGVITTHLKAKNHPEIRAIQLKKIIRAGWGLYTQTQPLIFTGDFNTDITEDCISHTRVQLSLDPTAMLDWTTWKERAKSSWQPGGLVKHAIDHFFIRSNVKVLSYLGPPEDNEVQDAGLLPGKRYSSDHLAISMDFVI